MRAEDSSVWMIAFHRSVAVTIGVLWALFVARWWWPSEARRELTRGLSEYVDEFTHCVYSAHVNRYSRDTGYV